MKKMDKRKKSIQKNQKMKVKKVRQKAIIKQNIKIKK